MTSNNIVNRGVITSGQLQKKEEIEALVHKIINNKMPMEINAQNAPMVLK